jgi:hypothetical protein
LKLPWAALSRVTAWDRCPLAFVENQMKFVKGCLGMIVLFFLGIGFIGYMVSKGGSSGSTSSAPTNTNQPSSPVDNQSPAPNLNAELVTAQSNLASAQTDAKQAKQDALDRIHQSAEYVSALADKKAAEDRVQADKSAGNLPTQTGQSLLNAKGKLSALDRSANSDASVVASQEKVAELQLVVDGINNKIDKQKSDALTAAQAAANAARKTNMESEFSAWDGSFKPLVKYIKENMNDPDSFAHVETKYFDHKDSMDVLMKYRGKNAFGGVVTNWVRATCNLDKAGNVLDVTVNSQGQ